MKKCKNCQTNLSGKQTKWCSTKCKLAVLNSRHKKYFNQQEIGKNRKLHLIALKGGCCELCGYKKSIAALCFHHIDPSTKQFSLDLRNLSNRKFELILEEANKCQLLCSNCHMEVHHGLTPITN